MEGRSTPGREGNDGIKLYGLLKISFCQNIHSKAQMMIWEPGVNKIETLEISEDRYSERTGIWSPTEFVVGGMGFANVGRGGLPDVIRGKGGRV